MPEGIEFSQVDPPDGRARAGVRERKLGAAAGASELGGVPLGRIGDLGASVAAFQGTCPPRPFKRPRLVVFAAEHGIAERGVSAYPAEATAELVATLRAGSAPLAVLADAAGVGVRVVDLAVEDGPSGPNGAAGAGHRRRSGSIDTADALTAEELHAAVRAGASAADSEVDAGADLLVAATVGVGASTPACTLVAALTGSEPVAVVGRGSGVDDAGWMRKTTAVRAALRRARPHVAEPLALLRVVGGADLAALAGFLAQAAVRRTPVLLDGLVVAVGAMVAEELAPGARAWWVAAHRTTDPGHALALDHLDLEPVLDLGLGGDTGVGAVAAVPLVLMAARVHAEPSAESRA